MDNINIRQFLRAFFIQLDLLVIKGLFRRIIMFTVICFKAVILKMDIQVLMSRWFIASLGIEPGANAIQRH